jgi:hypothetical protein
MHWRGASMSASITAREFLILTGIVLPLLPTSQ